MRIITGSKQLGISSLSKPEERLAKKSNNNREISICWGLDGHIYSAFSD